MAFEWEVVSELVEDEETIAEWLARDYEPFAVGPDDTGKTALWMKRHSFTERDERKSSTKPENRIEQEQPE